MSSVVLYIPGLGDKYDGFRSFGMKIWQLFGINAQLVPIKWYDKETLDSKLKRIEKAINEIDNKYNITLVGESAGASIALITASSKRTSKQSRYTMRRDSTRHYNL